MNLIEQDCSISHEGHTFTASGACVNDSRIVAYVGKPIGRDVHQLMTWKGDVIGTVRLTSSWYIRSCYADKMYAGIATVNGVRYVGRTMGECMAFTGKRKTTQAV